jgi:hypothetical protein
MSRAAAGHLAATDSLYFRKKQTMDNKLDFLMNLTGSKNNALSKAVSFDPSYVSRIRNGSRSMPRSPQFVEQAASYFSKRVMTDEQQELLASELCPGSALPSDKDELQMLIADWLYQVPDKKPDSVRDFLAGFSRAGRISDSMAFSQASSLSAADQAEALHRQIGILRQIGGENGYFYGNEGKRQAVELFLGTLCESGKAYDLLLFSDEEMSWLYEDPVFAKRWAMLLFKLLTTGSRIRIPHNITRDSNEMFEAVRKWIPLYMTGAIEPYYYPRLRDGVYRRSLFIAPGHSALISTSIGSGTNGMLNLIIRDKQAIEALVREFNNYLGLCRPLMQIYNTASAESCIAARLKFTRQPGETLTAQSLPSAFTMPQGMVRTLRQTIGSPLLNEFFAKNYSSFREQVRSGISVTEILHLPEARLVQEGKISLPFCDLFGAPDLKLSGEILRLQLKNVIRFLKREPYYRVVLSKQIPENLFLQVKDGVGSMLAHGEPPTTAFITSEFNMTAAFREYLVRIRDEALYSTRETVIPQLENYISKL